MKRNGFTLIEIIGAIVILGIIAIIAFSTYTASLKGFRESYYTREVKTIEKSAKEFFEDYRNYRPTKILTAQEVSLSTLETKDYLNNVLDYNGDNCNNSSYVIVVKEGLNDYSYHGCLICERDGFDNTQADTYCDKTWLDPTKVEYGIGDLDVAYIYKGTNREELRNELELPIAYVRKDDNGNVLATRRGTVEGNETIFPVNLDSIDTSTVGTYQVTYKYGNEEKDRVVKVYENGAPNITYQRENTIVKNMAGETQKDKQTYTDGEWAQNVIVSLSAKTYVDRSLSTKSFQWNLDGRWQDFCETDPCEITVTKEMNQQVQFRVLDSKGHVSLLTEPITMRIDNTKPRCTLQIPTTIGENSWYKSNVVINFGEKVDQKVIDDNSVVSGINNYNIQKSTETLNTTLKVNSKTQTDDTAGITYKGYVEDLAKNFGMCEITFKKDATAPSCTDSGDSKTWTNANRTITYGCSDSLSKCNTSYSGGTQTVSSTLQTVVIPSYTIKDNAGNTKTCAERTANVYVDKTAPSCTNSGDSTTWTNSNRTINYGCSDSDSGCNTSYSGGGQVFSTTTKTTTIEKYTIKDVAGNSKECPARTANVYVDKTAPSCTNGGDSTSWTASNRTITYGCSDSDSGCNSSYSGGSQAFSTTTKTATIAKYTIKDIAGNSKECAARTANVYVDKTAPSCTNGGDSTSWTASNRTITYGCSDSDSGCNSSYSGGSQSFNTTTKTLSIAAYTIKDKVGNQTTCAARTANVYVDKTAPSCTNSGDSTSWTNSNRTIYYGCSDSDSGCASGNSGGSKAFSSTTKTSSIAAYTIKDNAGNQTSCAARTANVYVDKTAPSCTNSGDSTSWTNSNRTIYYGCSDSDSGCASGNSGGSQAFSTTTKTSSIAAYTIKDNAGNQTSCAARTANVYVDKTAPSCTNSGDSTTWTSNNRTIYYGCSDSDSGCNASYSGGNKTFSTSTQTSTIAAYTIKDNAGNSKDCPARTANVYVTKAPPTCTVTKSNTYTEEGVTTSVSCSSAIGCDSSRNPTGDTGLKAGKTYTVYDTSGQSGTCSVAVSTQLQAKTWTCKNGYTCSRPGCGSETKTFSGSKPSCSGSCYSMGGASDLGGGQFRWNCTCYKTCSAPSVCGCGEWNPPSDWYNVSGCNTDGCVNGTYEGNSKWDDYRTVYY